MILRSTAAVFHSLNCFGYMIYMPQTSTYQNIAKLLTHLSSFIAFLFTQFMLAIQTLIYFKFSYSF